PNPFPRRDERVTVPTGCGAFPAQYDRRAAPAITNIPEARKAADTRYNVVYFTTMAHGGHFPAFEQPTLWVDDIRAFFRERRYCRPGLSGRPAGGRGILRRKG